MFIVLLAQTPRGIARKVVNFVLGPLQSRYHRKQLVKYHETDDEKS